MKATSDRGQRLTVAVGDGWMPTALGPERMKEELAILRRLCDEAGRDFEKIEITSGVYPWPETRAQARALAEAHEAAGTHRLFAIISGADQDPEGSVERLAELFLG
jgi:alkanesulfonate monooxygenase SsuD/methylene tetrahydromethanopterin reductase-like flavin-dependent oxidoreductase (luciferase family)